MSKIIVFSIVLILVILVSSCTTKCDAQDCLINEDIIPVNELFSDYYDNLSIYCDELNDSTDCCERSLTHMKTNGLFLASDEFCKEQGGTADMYKCPNSLKWCVLAE